MITPSLKIPNSICVRENELYIAVDTLCYRNGMASIQNCLLLYVCEMIVHFKYFYFSFSHQRSNDMPLL